MYSAQWSQDSVHRGLPHTTPLPAWQRPPTAPPPPSLPPVPAAALALLSSWSHQQWENKNVNKECCCADQAFKAKCKYWHCLFLCANSTQAMLPNFPLWEPTLSFFSMGNSETALLCLDFLHSMTKNLSRLHLSDQNWLFFGISYINFLGAVCHRFVLHWYVLSLAASCTVKKYITSSSVGKTRCSTLPSSTPPVCVCPCDATPTQAKPRLAFSSSQSTEEKSVATISTQKPYILV